MASDASGHPLSYAVGTANRHDQRDALKTIDRISVNGRRRRPRRIGADKGYDSDPIRRACRKRKIIPVFIARDKHVPDLTARERREQRYCRKRWQIERTFAWINMNRRIDRMLERKLKAYAMFMDLACIRHYLRLLAH